MFQFSCSYDRLSLLIEEENALNYANALKRLQKALKVQEREIAYNWHFVVREAAEAVQI